MTSPSPSPSPSPSASPSASPSVVPSPSHSAAPSASLSASTAVLKAEARLFAREPGSHFWIIAFPTILMTIIGLIPVFREVSDDLGGRRFIDLYTQVAVLLAMIFAGLQAMPPVLTGYRERGILRRMSTTPVRPGSLLAAQLLLHGAVALCAAVLPITVARIAFDVQLPRNPGGYALALVLATVSALALGAMVAALSRTQKAATAIGSAVFFPAMFTAGVWLPVQSMPDTLAGIVGFTPFGAASESLARAATGSWPAWDGLAVMAVWTLLLTGAAARWFRWE
ncbi:ABC transporter permease [Streptomyces sp. NPDC051018]|uniref:ABC transporter permease n=1 Tax=Streptomyces sp. NPDC051018 TaxID=3365639 RepID=UPI0037AC19D1